jgi:hypothetical protein
MLLDGIEPLNSKKIKCKKFAVCCRVTGVIEYETALNCRDDANKCGDVGIYYENRKLGP